MTSCPPNSAPLAWRLLIPGVSLLLCSYDNSVGCTQWGLRHFPSFCSRSHQHLANFVGFSSVAIFFGQKREIWWQIDPPLGVGVVFFRPSSRFGPKKKSRNLTSVEILFSPKLTPVKIENVANITFREIPKMLQICYFFH